MESSELGMILIWLWNFPKYNVQIACMHIYVTIKIWNYAKENLMLSIKYQLFTCYVLTVYIDIQLQQFLLV
jgi:hypothetical protein